MRNKIPVLFAFCILFFFVVGWVFYFLKQPLIPSSLFQEHTQQHQEAIKVNNTWIDAISNQQNNSYLYPTNEMILKYNFDRGIEPLRVFVEDLNEYRFYCINQILIQNKIEYAYYKTDKVIQLVIFLNNQEMQHKILEDFNYYNIKHSVHNSSPLS